MHFLAGLFFIWTNTSAQAESFEVSVEGWHHQIVRYAQAEDPLENTEVIKTAPSDLLAEEFEYAFNPTSPGAPLVVLVPGIFGKLDAAEIRWLGLLLHRKGFNVLRLVNPLSIPIFSRRPKYPGMDFESEARVYSQFIKSLQQEHGFSKIHLVGVSYGAFIGSVIAEQLGERLTGQVILISPPKNILTSLQIVDSYFEEMKEEVDSFPWEHLQFWFQMKWAYWTRQEIDLTPQLAKSVMVISGFHRGFLGLKDLAESLKNPDSSWVQFYKRWQPSVRKQTGALGFTSYLRDYNPRFFAHPKKHEVLYWLNKFNRPWHIYTSNDDFINRPSPWNHAPQITIFENGGHVFGYLDRQEFLESFLTKFD